MLPLQAVEKLALQGEVQEQVEQELEKFSLMDANSPEFTVTRNYLETIVALPWSDDTGALLAIAEGYAREAGLRNYEKALGRIHRKIARKSLWGALTLPITLKKQDLVEYLGKPVFLDEEIAVIKKPGMAIGLAWTPLGGAVLAIEAVANPGKLGEVMQESANLAYSYIRHISRNFEVSRDFWEKNIIHLHVPAGATPKDGPSAGITLASALLSLATRKKIRKSLAMTGELSLVGRVLPIGGLKEKVIAARRNRLKEVLYPEQNQRDLDEIPAHVREGITFHPVSTMDEVIGKIF
jgi:ATP-dependent Lon protease